MCYVCEDDMFSYENILGHLLTVLSSSIIFTLKIAGESSCLMCTPGEFSNISGVLASFTLCVLFRDLHFQEQRHVLHVGQGILQMLQVAVLKRFMLFHARHCD